jgi:23S rRNA (guanosine2251-2'-O)-methyltransferase
MSTPDRKLSMDELGRIAPTAYGAMPKRPIVAVLDDVRSRHNVGSLFRTADAFALERLVLCGFTPTPPHREIDKTALGATRSVPWEHIEDAVVAVLALKQQGYRVLAVEQTVAAAALPSIEHDPASPLALVFGNELNGVSEAVIAACDGCLMIPQAGSKHSLNVSVCAGVVLWWTVGRHIL